MTSAPATQISRRASAIDALRAALDDSPTIHRYGLASDCRPPRSRVRVDAETVRREVRSDDGILPLIGSKEGISTSRSRTSAMEDVARFPDPGYSPISAVRCSAKQRRTASAQPETNSCRCRRDSRRHREARQRFSISTIRTTPPRHGAERLSRTRREVCKKHDVLLVWDNAYSELAFDGYVPPSIFEIDGARDVALEFHSLSKTYNMTGWRCGWAVAKRSSPARSRK